MKPLEKSVMAREITKRKFAWLDLQLQKEIPTDIYLKAHSDNPKDHADAMAWLNENGYHFKDLGDGVCGLFKGSRKLAACKIMVEIKDESELCALAEAMYPFLKKGA